MRYCWHAVSECHSDNGSTEPANSGSSPSRGTPSATVTGSPEVDSSIPAGGKSVLTIHCWKPSIRSRTPSSSLAHSTKAKNDGCTGARTSNTGLGKSSSMRVCVCACVCGGGGASSPGGVYSTTLFLIHDKYSTAASNQTNVEHLCHTSQRHHCFTRCIHRRQPAAARPLGPLHQRACESTAPGALLLGVKHRC